VDPASHIKITHYFHPLGTYLLYQIVQNLIGDGFMEDAFVSIRPKVELEAFQLDTELGRNITDSDSGEIGLACARTHTGKLRALKADLVLPLWVRVRESL
jgi:hypothetical protein